MKTVNPFRSNESVLLLTSKAKLRPSLSVVLCFFLTVWLLRFQCLFAVCSIYIHMYIYIYIYVSLKLTLYSLSLSFYFSIAPTPSSFRSLIFFETRMTTNNGGTKLMARCSIADIARQGYRLVLRAAVKRPVHYFACDDLLTAICGDSCSHF